MKQKYILIVENTDYWLNENVNKKLAEGYILYGTPFSSDRSNYCHALILPEKENGGDTA